MGKLYQDDIFSPKILSLWFAGSVYSDVSGSIPPHPRRLVLIPLVWYPISLNKDFLHNLLHLIYCFNPERI